MKWVTEVGLDRIKQTAKISKKGNSNIYVEKEKN